MKITNIELNRELNSFFVTFDRECVLYYEFMTMLTPNEDNFNIFGPSYRNSINIPFEGYGSDLSSFTYRSVGEPDGLVFKDRSLIEIIDEFILNKYKSNNDNNDCCDDGVNAVDLFVSTLYPEFKIELFNNI